MAVYSGSGGRRLAFPGRNELAWLVPEVVLLPAAGLHLHDAGAPLVSPTAQLAAAAAFHAHVAGAPVLAVGYAIEPENALHAHIGQSSFLALGLTLLPAIAAHSHVAGQPAISVTYSLAPAGAFHSHVAGSPTLSFGDVSPIVGVSVLAEGWILAVTHTAGATAGSWRLPDNSTIPNNYDRTDAQWRNGGVDQFPLDPNGTPKIVLQVSDAGFVRSGGTAVAGNRVRTIAATKVMRRAFPNQGSIWETDNGNGTHTTYFALSDRVYSGSTVSIVSFLANWKQGAGAGVATGGTISNLSTATPPVPLARWAIPNLQLAEGTAGSPLTTVDVDVEVFSHHPEHDGANLHQAVAGVRAMATDGTTARYSWLGVRTSPLHGDSLRTWGGAVDVSGLNPGLVTLHYEVYPWIGTTRATGTMTSAGHSSDVLAGFSTAWATPRHIAFDPTGSRYAARRKFVFVDTTSTLTTVAQSGSVVLHDTLSAARSAATNTKPANLAVALQAMRSAATTLTGANGTSNGDRSTDFWEIVITDGQTIQGNGETVTTTSFLGAREGWLIIRGDPAASNPRATCAVQSHGSSQPWPAARVCFRDCRLAMGHATLFGSTSNSATWLDRVDVRAKATYQAGTQGLRTSQVFGSYITNADMRDYNGQPVGQLMRNVTRTAGGMAGGHTFIGVKVNRPAGGDYAPARTGDLFDGNIGDDVVIRNCEAYEWDGRVLAKSNATWGTGTALIQRLAMVNSVFEGGASVGPAIAIGETGNSQLRNSLIEGCVFVGSRINLHNDANLFTNSSVPGCVVTNGTTSVTIGLIGHGIVNGDTVVIANVTAAGATAMNGTYTAGTNLTVLDANRFTITASATCNSTEQGGGRAGTVAVNGGAARDIVRENLRHTGNSIRYTSFDRNATKHDQFNGDATLTGSWELLYGVSFRGNINANRNVGNTSDFQYAWPGLGADVDTTYLAPDANWHGYVDDRSPNGGPGGFGGDYRADTATLAPYKPSRLIGKGTAPASIDRFANGTTRGNPFAAGALGTA